MKVGRVLSRLRTAASLLSRELRVWLFSGFIMLFLLVILSLIGFLHLQAFFESDLDFDDDIRPMLIACGIVLVLIRLGIAAIPGLVRWIEEMLDSPRSAGSPLESGESLESLAESPSTASIVKQLRFRARRLRRVANLLFAIIVILLACGFFAFQGADLAAARWNAMMTGPLQSEASNTRIEIQNLFSGLALNGPQEQGKASQRMSGNPGRGPGKVSQRLDVNPPQEPFKGLPPEDVHQPAHFDGGSRNQEMDKASIEKELDFEEADLSRIEENLSLLSPSKSPTVFLVSTLSTKIGSVLLLIFLVQHLSSLYRYNIRLAVFCDSRADLLQMLTPSFRLGADAMASFLSTEQAVGIDDPPLSPIQQVAGVLHPFGLGKKE